MTKQEKELYNLIFKYEEILRRVESVSNYEGKGTPGATYGDTEYDSMAATYGYNQAMSHIYQIVKNSTNSQNQ